MFHQPVYPFRYLGILPVIHRIVGLDIQYSRIADCIQPFYRQCSIINRKDLNRCDADLIGSVLSSLRKNADQRHVLPVLRPPLQMLFLLIFCLIQIVDNDCMGKAIQTGQPAMVLIVQNDR